MNVRQALSALAAALLWAFSDLSYSQEFPEGDLPKAAGFESGAPEELLPATVEPGLLSRAIPTMPEPVQAEQIYPFYRLQIGDDIRRLQLPEYRFKADPSSFRPVIVNAPPIGLYPEKFRSGVFEIYPFFGLAQSFDSNVNLTSQNEIADFYITPRAGTEFQIGTPDSVYNEYYDTILALNGRYEAWGDIYYTHPELSAFNQTLELSGRVGRSSAIWRPYFQYTDLTGSNLLNADLTNRTRRIRVSPSLIGEYKVTSTLMVNQLFSFSSFQHPDPGYINTLSGGTRQELAWSALKDTRVSVWGAYRYTQPAQGFAGSETVLGFGVMGKPDPRIYTEIRIGWAITDMDGYVPGRRNMSGIRFNGHTTFEWGPRFRLTLRYDRDYVYNEVTPNDNYTSTLLQTRGEFFLGGNWYITPYLGVSIQDFETSHAMIIQYRPELEVSYALPSDSIPNGTRVYAKAGYMKSQNIKGEGEPIEDFRLSIGFNWQY